VRVVVAAIVMDADPALFWVGMPVITVMGVLANACLATVVVLRSFGQWYSGPLTLQSRLKLQRHMFD
jgi:hypothetical protein